MSDTAASQQFGSADFGRLEPGFADPVRDAQACFRTILEAMAHPGRIVTLPVSLVGAAPAPLGTGAASIALTLCDIDTPVWLDEASAGAAGYLAFHSGAPLAVNPGEAWFAFISDARALPQLNTFALGADDYPERSATVVIEIAGFAGGSGVTLRGPGIRDATRLGIAGLSARFWTERAALGELFPRGIDVLFVSGGNLAALPRSIRIEV
jgi:alpha-D-ribose 1-methylphosphonate 5-triphosphate synthase subunit PhnH